MAKHAKRRVSAAALAAFVASLLVVTGPAGAAVSTASQLVHLPFDGSLADVSGNANNAQLAFGAALVPAGHTGGALAFDGVDDLARLSDPNAIGGTITDRTVSVWFNADATANRQIVFELGGSVRGHNIYLRNGSVYIGAWNTPAAESGWKGAWLSAPVSAGEWHHVALILDGGPTISPGALRAYLDGDPIGSAAGSQLNGGGTPGIGRNDGFTTYDDIGAKSTRFGLKGRVDELRIWNRVLTPAEITELAGGGPAPVNQPPTADAGDDLTVTDSDAGAVPLAGSVTDDGLPGGALSAAWSVVAQPSAGAATIANPSSASTTVALADVGAYTFRLTADDTALQASDEVTITVVADPAGEALRIMPVGDSITEARDGPDKRGLPSWRKWFWDLTQADDREVDMVGSRSGVADGDNLTVAVPPPPTWGVWDWDHDGHYGWRADEILNGRGDQPAAGRISDWADDQQPDVFLIHIGTNDLAQGQGVANAITDVRAIIDAIRAEQPDAKIAISKIIKNRPKAIYPNLPADIAAFNAQIPGVAAAKSTPASPVIVVDHATGWNVSTDNYDTLHPSVAGQQKMAQKFYAAMVAAGWFAS